MSGSFVSTAMSIGLAAHGQNLTNAEVLTSSRPLESGFS